MLKKNILYSFHKGNSNSNFFTPKTKIVVGHGFELGTWNSYNILLISLCWIHLTKYQKININKIIKMSCTDYFLSLFVDVLKFLKNRDVI